MNNEWGYEIINVPFDRIVITQRREFFRMILDDT